jgi:lipopolysaccharide/colanic/teichoic acid biosynthesis glycosyltransferase
MRVWPIILDDVPPYLGRSGGSLLLAPIGAKLLVARLCDRIAAVTSNAPLVLPPIRSGPSYHQAMRQACDRVRTIPDNSRLADLVPLETSDAFLFVDARCFPIDDEGLPALVAGFSAGPTVAHHLVTFEPSMAGTKEHVNTDVDGRVISVHRYYEHTTWPFLSGVAASLVPVSISLLHPQPVPGSLVELRQLLVASGAPSRDVAGARGALDLTGRQGLLTAMEHCVAEDAARARPGEPSATILVGSGQTIAPSARILGPVVVHPDVCIEEHATIVGPAVLGAGSHVAAGAVVAHALVGPHSRVPGDRALRDRVWYNDLDDRDRDRPETPFQERVARLRAAPDATSTLTAAGEPGNPSYLLWKRAFDVVASFTGLVLLSPLFLVLAALTRLGSRGPVFYGSEREGLGGRPFTCLKFRTMQDGAHNLQHALKSRDKLDGPHFKLERDPRVTALGRVLRATNLDELSQLINVFRGDMSLVGPRPSPFRENQICVPWRVGRLSVRPGVTGLWQVCRKDRAAGDFHQWIEYDLLYVQQASLLLDFKILVATVISLGGAVPVPASWLVRVPPPVPVDEGTGVVSRQVRTVQVRGSSGVKPPASSRTA